MIPPSKELLSAVFSRKIDKVEHKTANTIEYWEEQEDGWTIKEINIYELAVRKVKGWAKKYGYGISSDNGEDIGDLPTAIVFAQKNGAVYTYYRDTQQTEPEAIFRAGEWILNRMVQKMKCCENCISNTYFGTSQSCAHPVEVESRCRQNNYSKWELRQRG